MTVLFEPIDDFCGGNVEFYTVKLDGRDMYEFEAFEKNDFPDHKEELDILYGVIDEMKYRGAHSKYFKFEEDAHAMPYVSEEIKQANTIDWGIRLYCIHINESKVVLLNGHIKTKLDPSTCDNVKDHFKLARRIGYVLNKAIVAKDINILEPWSLDQFKLRL